MVFVLCYNHSVTGSSPFSPTSSCLHPLGVVGLSYSWTILLFSVILYPFVPILSFFPLDFLRCFKYLCVVFSYLWLCNFFCNFFFMRKCTVTYLSLISGVRSTVASHCLHLWMYSLNYRALWGPNCTFRQVSEM